MIRRNIVLFFFTLCACIGFSFIAINITKSKPSINPPTTEIVDVDSPIKLPISNPNNAIQVALILDTSGSMNGLIEQAKSQLWNILNVLARSQKNDKESDLQIALYEYGNPYSTKDNYQIRQLSGFTTDMDLISEKLFSLTTGGGEEYCGAVISKSLEDLSWNNDESLKMIYIAGNEPFTQGPIDYKSVCKKAKSNGIIVNTIFCGNQNDGVSGNWNLGAKLGGGDFISISQNEETVYIPTPFDSKIEDLNLKLNDTYIPYGDKGNEKKMNQVLQDDNAKVYSRSNAADRASFKSSKKYKAEDWDLVDAYKKDKSILKNADLKSEKYKSMSIEELEENIEAASTQRESIQTEIKELDKKRREYKTKATLKNGNKGKSLQHSIIQTITKQAEKKGYKINE